MLVVNLTGHVVREVIVLGRIARFPVVPGPLGVDRVHPAQLFDTFPQWILFSHTVFYGIPADGCYAA